jgi:hypothetical protein
MTKIDPRWSPNMMRRPGSTHEAQQVRCLTGDQGSEWIHGLDDLPSPVRRRLARSVHNICPTCVKMEARSNARGVRQPTIDIYNAVIAAIERKLAEVSSEPAAPGPVFEKRDAAKG